MGVLSWNDAVDIGGNRGRLARAAAASLARVDVDMRSAFGRAADINEAWRSPEQANANYARYLAFLAGGPWAPIALPGDKSVHCFGEAVDTDDTSDAQMRIWNDHGWYWTVYRNGKLAERWHLEYFISRDNHRNDPAYSNVKPFEEDDMFGDNDRRDLGALKDAVAGLAANARPAHHAAPINFRSTTGGMSFTMIPGVQIIRHENTIAAALTLEFTTGEKWPGWESERNPGGEFASQRQREDVGERQLRDDEILVILSKFGFEWASRNIARLPDYGKVLYADWIKHLQGEDITT